MSDTSAQRSRRYRLHKRGDHSECDARRCDSPAATVVTPRPPVMPPARLGLRGNGTWRSLGGEDLDLPYDERLLVDEAARLADRLDRLDKVLMDKDEWLTFRRLNEDESIVKVVMNAALVEARQQQTALTTILRELRQMRAAAKPVERRGAGGQRRVSGVGAAPVVPEVTEGGNVVSLAARAADLFRPAR